MWCIPLAEREAIETNETTIKYQCLQMRRCLRSQTAPYPAKSIESPEAQLDYPSPRKSPKAAEPLPLNQYPHNDYLLSACNSETCHSIYEHNSHPYHTSMLVKLYENDDSTFYLLKNDDSTFYLLILQEL